MSSLSLLVPPVLFVVVLTLVGLQALGMRVLVLKPKQPGPPGKYKPYACGEPAVDNRVQPDYGSFFKFAFFFTIMHVLALLVATVPSGSLTAAFTAAGFILCAGVGLLVLYRR